jgi:uncharacterized protein
MVQIMPELTPENTAFWTGGRIGKLMIAHCNPCDHSIHPPQVICPKCLSRSVTSRPAIGTGTVLARTVNRQQWSPDSIVPYALAVVELDGEQGVRITASLVECDPEKIAIGDQLEVTFEQHQDIWLPRFRPIVNANMGETVAA